MSVRKDDNTKRIHKAIANENNINGANLNSVARNFCHIWQKCIDENIDVFDDQSYPEILSF